MIKSIFVNHIFPVLIAVFISFLLYSFCNICFISEKDVLQSNPEEVDINSMHISNFVSDPTNIDIVKNALSNAKIVIMGSSELQDRGTDYQPDQFIPESIGYPAVSIGHAGNQNHSIMSQLAGLYDHLDNSKIVIIESPGWFEAKFSKGTSIESFLEYNTNEILLSAYYNSDIPENTKKKIAEFISRKYADINNPGTVINLYYYYHQSEKSWIHNIIYKPLMWFSELSIKIDDILYKNSSKPGNKHITESKSVTYNKEPVSWDSLYMVGLENAKRNSTNNNWGVSDTYYSKYVNGKKSNIYPVSLKKNTEYQDFKNLIDLLKTTNSEVIFIIQPLNPYAYKNLDKLEIAIDSITFIMDKNGYPYLNLFVSDTSEFEKGILKDIMHMGDYGWIKTSKFINDNLIQHNEKE